MGSYKFKMSNMLPNACFYKLKDMIKVARAIRSKKKRPTSTREQQKKVSSITKQPHHSNTRKSYYFTRELVTRNEGHCKSPKDTPRKSAKHKVKIRAMPVSPSPPNKLVNSSFSTGCRKKTDNKRLGNSTSSSPKNETGFRSDNALPIDSFDRMLSLSSSCACRVANTSTNSSDKDIIISIDKNSLSNKIDNKFDSLDVLAGSELPHIITKHVKCKEANADGDFIVGALNPKNNVTEKVKKPHVKRYSRNFPGVRLRVNSPRISDRKMQSHWNTRKRISSLSLSSRISLLSSYAVVKTSSDPKRDFKESMWEMIIENNIKSSKDLEDLLACYLTLNLDEYHAIIIRVFKEILCGLTSTNYS